MDRPIETIPVRIDFADGAVAVMQIVMDDGRSIKRFTLTQADIDREVRKVYPRTLPAEQQPVGYQVIGFDAIPSDRLYRAAWTADGDGIAHDLDKAREVHRGLLRRVRQPLLNDLDGQYLRALEVGDEAAQQQIAKEKQALRDLPADPAIVAAASVDDLRAAWPADLVGSLRETMGPAADEAAQTTEARR